MYGFQKRPHQAPPAAPPDDASARGFRAGGLVRGPGTGTSDSVKDAVPPGTYIMPADSTRQIGPDALGAAGFRPDAIPKNPDDPPLGFGKNAGKVPVNLSNGEFRLSPRPMLPLRWRAGSRCRAALAPSRKALQTAAWFAAPARAHPIR